MSVPESTTGNDYEQRTYIQERELFTFLCMGLSALESLVYGLYFMASWRYPSRFPIQHLLIQR